MRGADASATIHRCRRRPAAVGGIAATLVAILMAGARPVAAQIVTRRGAVRQEAGIRRRWVYHDVGCTPIITPVRASADFVTFSLGLSFGIR